MKASPAKVGILEVQYASRECSASRLGGLLRRRTRPEVPPPACAARRGEPPSLGDAQETLRRSAKQHPIGTCHGNFRSVTYGLRVSYKRHRFPAQVIAHAVWLYFRFPLRWPLFPDGIASGFKLIIPPSSQVHSGNDPMLLFILA